MIGEVAVQSGVGSMANGDGDETLPVTEEAAHQAKGHVVRAPPSSWLSVSSVWGASTFYISPNSTTQGSRAVLYIELNMPNTRFPNLGS